MLRLLFLLFLCSIPIASAHEFDPNRIDIMDANAEVLDGDTSTLFVQMTIANGAPTTKITGFNTRFGKIGDWVEVRRFFGRETLKIIKTKTIRTQTLYEMHRPNGYLVITDVDPIVYTCNYGYILVQVEFEDDILDAAVWIDPLYTQICN